MGNELDAIRRRVKDCVGERVELVCSMRRKTQRSKCVIESAYQTIFTVVYDCRGEMRRTSYTYVDLFTKAIVIKRLA